MISAFDRLMVTASLTHYRNHYLEDWAEYTPDQIAAHNERTSAMRGILHSRQRRLGEAIKERNEREVSYQVERIEKIFKWLARDLRDGSSSKWEENHAQ